MLNELSHIEKDKYCKISFICESKKIIQMSVYVKQKQTHRENKQVFTRGKREAGSGKLGMWDEEIQTTTYETDKQQGYSI